ncbi:MAG: hypothetical protein WA655_08750 [Candidatus Korobacteraceae bacterium]
MKKKVDPLKEAEKARQDAARMKQMGEATGPSRRKPWEDGAEPPGASFKRRPGSD